MKFPGLTKKFLPILASGLFSIPSIAGCEQRNNMQSERTSPVNSTSLANHTTAGISGNSSDIGGPSGLGNSGTSGMAGMGGGFSGNTGNSQSTGNPGSSINPAGTYPSGLSTDPNSIRGTRVPPASNPNNSTRPGAAPTGLPGSPGGTTVNPAFPSTPGTAPSGGTTSPLSPTRY